MILKENIFFRKMFIVTDLVSLNCKLCVSKMYTCILQKYVLFMTCLLFKVHLLTTAKHSCFQSRSKSLKILRDLVLVLQKVEKTRLQLIPISVSFTRDRDIVTELLNIFSYSGPLGIFVF